MAVRIALGAGRADLLGQLLTESVVLAVTAATVGLGLAWWWMRLLRSMIGAQLPQWMVVELDWRVLLFTLFVSLLVGVCCRAWRQRCKPHGRRSVKR